MKSWNRFPIIKREPAIFSALARDVLEGCGWLYLSDLFFREAEDGRIEAEWMAIGSQGGNYPSGTIRLHNTLKGNPDYAKDRYTKQPFLVEIKNFETFTEYFCFAF